MIASAEPLEPFESEAAKVAYCRGFLEQRGYAVAEPLPEQRPRDREPRSIAYILNSVKRPCETQERSILEALAALGSSVPPLVGAFVDEFSAASKRLTDRPLGRKFWNTLDRGDHLWITHYDHLGRDDLESLLELERIFRRGVVIHVVEFLGTRFLAVREEDMTYVTMLRDQIVARRQFISERTKAGMAQARAAGRLGNGVPPIGFRKEGRGTKARYKASFHDQRVCNIVWRLRHEHGWSIYRLCKELRARRVLIPPGHSQGRGWCDERIKKVVAYESLPFPDCPEGATKMDDLLDAAACKTEPPGQNQ